MKDGMPETVGICYFKDGTYEVYPDLADIPPSTSYTLTSTVTAKIEAAEGLVRVLTGIKTYCNFDNPNREYVAILNTADMALAEYKRVLEGK